MREYRMEWLYFPLSLVLRPKVWIYNERILWEEAWVWGFLKTCSCRLVLYFGMILLKFGMKIYHYILFLLANWEKTCFGPIKSLFTYYHNIFLSQNNVQDDMKKFQITKWWKFIWNHDLKTAICNFLVEFFPFVNNIWAQWPI